MPVLPESAVLLCMAEAQSALAFLTVCSKYMDAEKLGLFHINNIKSAQKKRACNCMHACAYTACSVGEILRLY